RSRWVAALADVASPGASGDLARNGLREAAARFARPAEMVVIPLIAFVAGLVLFGLFIALFGKNPLQLYGLMIQGAVGTWFSIQQSLARAAPLLLAALCVALPARLGLVVIGGEGAIVLGGVAAAALAPLIGGVPGIVGVPLMALFAMAV